MLCIHQILLIYIGKLQNDDLPIRLLIANYILNPNDKRIINIIQSYFNKHKNNLNEEDVTSRSGEDLVQCISL